jgi:hypothetical protein
LEEGQKNANNKYAEKQTHTGGAGKEKLSNARKEHFGRQGENI